MTARNIAKESDEVVKMAMMVAEGCTDRRMKRVSDQLLELLASFHYFTVGTLSLSLTPMGLLGGGAARSISSISTSSAGSGGRSGAGSSAGGGGGTV